MIGIGIGLWGMQGGRAGFNADDIANGTLVLDFVSAPPKTLDLDFAMRAYSQWASDPSTPALVGYYQVKG